MIGSGPNGLTCANYLAKAGIHTLLIERLSYVGGGVKSLEKIPYFKYNTCANSFMAVPYRPPFKDLELWRYCEMILPEVQMSLATENGKALTFHTSPEKTAASIRKFSGQDAETYLKQDKLYKGMLNKVFIPQSYSDPFLRTDKDEAAHMGNFEEGRLALDFRSQTLLTHAEETWDSEIMKVWECMEAIILGISFTKIGSTIAIPSQSMLRTTFIVKGGSGNFALALRKAFVESGGEILENNHVSRVLVRNGRAEGVELANGRKIMARKFVVSSVDVRQSFQNFVDFDSFPYEWKLALRAYRYETVTDLGIFMALKEKLRFNNKLRNYDSDINSAFRVFIGFNTMDDLRREEKEIADSNYSKEIDQQRFQLLNPTKYDASQAPAGRHVSFIWDFVKCGANTNQKEEWDMLGPVFALRDKSQLRRYAPNMVDENILDTFVYTPLDVERNLINMIGGGLQMRSPEMDPRALPSVRTPIEGYYYCGAGTFPGGAVTLAPGYIAANVISKIEGIEPWWVPLDWKREYPFLK